MTVQMLSAGEPAPWFSAPIVGNQRELFALDEAAGPLYALFIFGSTAQPGVSDTLKSLINHNDLFDDRRARLVGVATDPNMLPPTPDPGATILWDSSATAARLYGLADPASPVNAGAIRPTCFILGPTLQILDIVPLTEPGGFVHQVTAIIAERLAHPAPVHSAPVLIVPRVFDRDVCAQLVAGYDAAGGREIGVLEQGGKALAHFDPKFRQRLDWYITEDAAQQQIRGLMVRRLLPMVYRAFQFRTTRIERYLVGCYDALTGGHFAAHRDNTAPPVAHRRFAVTINLNADYDGGALRFPEFGPQTYRAAPGDAIVFSCSLLHEVLPITGHRRYAFLSFIYDEDSQRLRDDYVKRATEAQQLRTA